MARKPPKPEVLAFGRAVRAAREQQGKTQEQVSAGSRIHVTEVSRIERGERDPKVSTVIRLAQGVGVSPADLFDGIE